MRKRLGRAMAVGLCLFAAGTWQPAGAFFFCGSFGGGSRARAQRGPPLRPPPVPRWRLEAPPAAAFRSDVPEIDARPGPARVRVNPWRRLGGDASLREAADPPPGTTQESEER
jgi:hypothetical protein